MIEDPLRTTLDTLRSEREGAERRAVELGDELKEIAQRLTHLRGAIESIEALLGVPSVEEETVLADGLYDEMSDASAETDFTNSAEATPAEREDTRDLTDPYKPYEPVARRRVPSTDWVAEVVERIGHPADRDDIFKAFRHYKGFPDSWTNPRNSVNNALGRAVERGMVRKLEENLFAPLSYKALGSATNDREES